MNEHQSLWGDAFGGRPELVDTTGIIDYGSLMYLALQRARTAREAIHVMTSLVAQHGYNSSGESFSVSDPNEVWILEMIGKGPGNKGAVWVALRVPDGYICGHANQARITTFPRNDTLTCLYSPDVVTVARQKGYFEGSDESFSFSDVMPVDFGAARFCSEGVAGSTCAGGWIHISTMPATQSDPSLPLWIKPDETLRARCDGTLRDYFRHRV